MGGINIIKELGVSLLSFSILCIVVHFLAKIFITTYNDFKFSNPKKSAFYAIIAVTISSCMVTGLMFLLKLQSTLKSTSNTQEYTLNSVLSIAILWIIILLPILIIKKIRKESWESTGISKHNLKASILIGFILAIITIAEVILFSSKSLGELEQNLTLNVLWGLLYFIVVGFCEEFMFRGYLQTRLIQWVGRWKGWLLTSIVMALIHIPQRMASMGLSPKEAIISALLLIPISLTMGYIMIKTENIIAVGIYHTFANWVNILM